MEIESTPKFRKQLKKLPLLYQKQFLERIKLFIVDQTDPRLRVHPLKGRYAGCWSMNINGDIRVIYQDSGDSIILLILIGTHSQLYG